MTRLLDPKQIFLHYKPYISPIGPIGPIRPIRPIRPGLSETEAGGEVEVAVAVVETVLDTLIPMSLMVKVESVEKVAGGAHQSQATVQIGRQQGLQALNGIGETMTVANTGHHGDVEEPAVMEHPTVSIAYHESEVTIAETVVCHMIRQMNLEITSQEGHVHHYILMTEVDTRQQRA